MKKIILSLMFCVSFFMANSLLAFNYEGYPEGVPLASVSATSTASVPTNDNEGYPQRDIKLSRGVTPPLTCRLGTTLTQAPVNEFEGYPRPDPTCQVKR
jgi:hypothetical protein